MLNILQEIFAYLRPWIPHLVIGIAIHLLFLKKFYNNHIQPKWVWLFSLKYFITKEKKNFCFKFFCRFFSWFYPFLANYHVTCREIKRKHFESMKDHKSVDPELRKKGGLRILEIGPGPGYNFEFYPPNSELTAVEVNPFFEEQFFKQQVDHPHIKMNRFVVGFAEKMKDVPDNSIDIVVSTMVLCSVRSIEEALKEIHRILAPVYHFIILSWIQCLFCFVI